MKKLLESSILTNCITSYLVRNELWNKKNLSIFYIINPVAGCFTKKAKSIYYCELFLEAQKKISELPIKTLEIKETVFVTEYSGQGKEISQKIVEQIQSIENDTKNNPDNEYVIVIAGGDGTSLEVQDCLFHLAQNDEQKKFLINNRITLLRLPLGTGNDGTDGHKMEETFEMLSGKLKFQNAPAVKIYPEKCSNMESENAVKFSKNPTKYNPEILKYPWYAFNIASIGLDAYAVYLTNKLKKQLPGNFYQLCVPLSGIMYDKDFPSGTAKMDFMDENGNVFYQETNPITIFVFGASGKRYYGGGHYILPQEENVCHAPKISFLKLIEVNRKFIDGSFVGGNVAFLHSAKKVRFDYDKEILLQCDGEVVMLSKDHFPLIFEVTDPCLRVLTKA